MKVIILKYIDLSNLKNMTENAFHLTPRALEEEGTILPVVGLPDTHLEERPRRFFDLATFPLISSPRDDWTQWFKTELLSGRQELMSKLVSVLTIGCVDPFHS